MPDIAVKGWLTVKGESWSTVATALGVTKASLVAANGGTIDNKGNVSPALTVGRILLVPFLGGPQ